MMTVHGAGLCGEPSLTAIATAPNKKKQLGALSSFLIPYLNLQGFTVKNYGI